jgi:hypothetical protein
MIQKIKEWLFNKKPQFTLFTEVKDKEITLLAHLHKCKQVVVIGDRYKASWHRGISIVFVNPSSDMIHMGYLLLDPVGIIHDKGIIPANEIRFEKGVFRIGKH